MKEGDEGAVRAWPWRFVNQANAPGLQVRECRDDVVHAQRDVMHPRSPFREKPGDRRVSSRRFEKFQGGVPHRNEMRADTLRRDFFRWLDLEAQRVAIEGQGVRQAGDRDSRRDREWLSSALHLRGQILFLARLSSVQDIGTNARKPMRLCPLRKTFLQKTRSDPNPHRMAL